MFDCYTSRTNGKQKIADYLTSRFAPDAAVLDLGAGNGELTARLAGHFHRVVAVERDARFAERLRGIGGVVVIEGRIEEVPFPDGCDLALLSYSFTGIPGEYRRDTIGRVLRSLSRDGELLVVTYREGCPWDEFAGRAAGATGTARTSGGTAWHLTELERLGVRGDVVASLDTSIWGSSTEDLLRNLLYFVKERGRLASYLLEARRLLDGLAAVRDDGTVGLPVIEDVIRVR